MRLARDSVSEAERVRGHHLQPELGRRGQAWVPGQHANGVVERPVLVERDHQPVQPLASADASESDRAFLAGFFAGEPDWSLLPYPHVSGLAALARKPRNLEIFRSKRPMSPIASAQRWLPC